MVSETGAKGTGVISLSLNNEPWKYAPSELYVEKIELKGDIWLRKNYTDKIDTSNTAAVHEKLTLTTDFYFISGDKAELWLEMRDFSDRIIYAVEGINITRGKDGKGSKTIVIDGLKRGFRSEIVAFEWHHGPNKSIGTRMSTIYFFPHKPNAPWVWDKDDDQNPWVTALDMLLEWGVYDYSDVTKIATQITEYVNSSKLLKYASGAQLIKNNIFNCTGFINDINKKKDIEVNCSDCAAIVSTLSNLLGANLYQTRFGIGGMGFTCNKIKAIGSNEWKLTVFTYHEIAFVGVNTNIEANIYDASVKVNPTPKSNPNPSTKTTGKLPTNMQFALFRAKYEDKQESSIKNAAYYENADMSNEGKYKYREMLIENITRDIKTTGDYGDYYVDRNLYKGVLTGHVSNAGRRRIE